MIFEVVNLTNYLQPFKASECFILYWRLSHVSFQPIFVFCVKPLCKRPEPLKHIVWQNPKVKRRIPSFSKPSQSYKRF